MIYTRYDVEYCPVKGFVANTRWGIKPLSILIQREEFVELMYEWRKKEIILDNPPMSFRIWVNRYKDGYKLSFNDHSIIGHWKRIGPKFIVFK